MTNRADNIILIGFMASGKSRIGEMLAKHLSYECLDVDNIIERDHQRSIKEIIADQGEPYFREQETAVIKNFAGVSRAVIVTGGGAPMTFTNAEELKKLGTIFFLDANLPIILERLKNSDDRPLGVLRDQNDIARITSLFAFRRPLYLDLGIAIDVNHQDRDRTCDEIIKRYKSLMTVENLSSTTVHAPFHRYPIVHQRCAIEHVADILSATGLKHHRPVIVTSDRLATILSEHLAIISKQFSEIPGIITILDGEANKNFSSVTHIHNEMFRLGLTRKSVALAVGGGNVGDVAGFAASIFLRGVPFVQIPTTLLAMVDASIGGKTGVDNDFGKNLVGSFYHPHAVVIDANFLELLPRSDFACGMAEIIKHGIIADADLFYSLRSGSLDIETIIKRAIVVKANIVRDDPRESNIRAHLNLGHTFAHAIEKVSDYKIKHGEAVGMGLVLASDLSSRLGILEKDFRKDLKMILEKFGLATTVPKNLAPTDLINAMSHDKKRDAAGLQFVVPLDLGKIVMKHVDTKIIHELLEGGC